MALVSIVFPVAQMVTSRMVISKTLNVKLTVDKEWPLMLSGHVFFLGMHALEGQDRPDKFVGWRLTNFFCVHMCALHIFLHDHPISYLIRNTQI